MFYLDNEGLITTDYALKTGGTAPLFCDDGVEQRPKFKTSDSKEWYKNFKAPYRVSILGLGDVGGTLAMAMRTIGSDYISEIGICDLNENRLSRYEMELNQVYEIGRRGIPVVKKSLEDLFNTDIFIFTASKAVPPVGSEVKDVRMAQFEANANLISYYVEQAVSHDFKGFFCIVSDPVDLLCKVALETAKKLKSRYLTPIHFRGFGLGVMYARARYYAKQMGVTSFDTDGRVYGPHGLDLIVLNSVGKTFDLKLSKALTQKVVTANLEVRALGFKPYIAPAISSGAYSIIAMLEGRWHHSAIPFNNQFLGIKNRLTSNGVEIEPIPYNIEIDNWIKQTLKQLEKYYGTVYSM